MTPLSVASAESRSPPGPYSATLPEVVVGRDIEIEVLPESFKEPGSYSSVDSRAWETLTGVVRDVFPEAIVTPYVLTGQTDSRFFEGAAGDVHRSSRFTLDGEGLSGFHGTNESVRVEDAQRPVTFFARLTAVGAAMDRLHGARSPGAM